MATVRYSISKIQQAGRAEVRMRFTAGRGIDFQTMTRIFVPVRHWDAKAGALVFSTRFVNAETAELQRLRIRLDELQQAVLDAYMRDPSKCVRVEWLRACVENYHHPEGVPERMTLSEICNRYKTSAQLAESTQRVYTVIEGMLDRYGSARHVLYSDTTTSDDLDDLQAFLRCETRGKGKSRRTIERGRNTIATKFKKLRAACVWAYRRKLMPHNPFEGYSIPGEVYGSVVCLTIEERDKVAAAEMPSEALAVQRDIFVFQCHVGCRVSDLIRLTHSSVTADGFLEYVARKTKHVQQKTIRVPLDDVALQIVERYRESDPVRLLPFISPEKYNVSIKKVLKAAGIDRVVLVYDSTHDRTEHKAIYEIGASHLARRTFSSCMFHATMSDRITASMTGHSPSSKAFSRYAEVNDDMKRAAIGKISQNPDEIPT